MGPELPLLEAEGEGPRTDRCVGERRPDQRRRIDRRRDTGAGIRRTPLPEHRDRHRELEVEVVLDRILKPEVLIVVRVQIGAETLREVGRVRWRGQVDLRRRGDRMLALAPMTSGSHGLGARGAAKRRYDEEYGQKPNPNEVAAASPGQK